MTGVAWQGAAARPCPECAGLGGAHYLTCPALRLCSACQGRCVCSCAECLCARRREQPHCHAVKPCRKPLAGTRGMP